MLGTMRRTLEDFVEEVTRSIGFWNSLSRRSEIDRVVLCGGGSHLAGLEEALGEQVSAPIQRLALRLFAGKHAPGREFADTAPKLAISFGLALQGLGCATLDIDLLKDAPEGTSEAASDEARSADGGVWGIELGDSSLKAVRLIPENDASARLTRALASYEADLAAAKTIGDESELSAEELELVCRCAAAATAICDLTGLLRPDDELGDPAAADELRGTTRFIQQVQPQLTLLLTAREGGAT